MTYNVHRCIGLDGRHRPERIAAVLARFDPDVACLQELDVNRPRTGRVDQPRRIADALQMDAHFHGAVRVAEEQFGAAVLSRLPMRKVRSGPLPTLLGMKLEPRAALWVEVRARGGRCRCSPPTWGSRGESAGFRWTFSSGRNGWAIRTAVRRASCAGTST
jgi:endonuclease/exonuclease/phosphatase family metal-dependent hydrolase